MKKLNKIVCAVMSVVLLISAVCVTASATVAVADNSAFPGSRSAESHSGTVIYLNGADNLFTIGNFKDSTSQDCDTGGNVNILFDFCFGSNSGAIDLHNDNSGAMTITKAGYVWNGSANNNADNGVGKWHRAEIRLSNTRADASISLFIDGSEKASADSCYTNKYNGSSDGREWYLTGNDVYIDNVAFDFACKARYVINTFDGAPTNYNMKLPMSGGTETTFTTVSLMYNANGGSNAPAATSVVPGASATVTSQVPTAPNSCSTFKCWNTNAQGTGSNYYAGNSIIVNSATTLYAIWNVNHTPVEDKAVAATCTTDGKTAGSHCSVCSTVITAQQTVTKLGHAWDEGVVQTPATCTVDGVMLYTCTRCPQTKTEAITKKGHTPVTDPAKAPTCTEPGLTEGSHCSVCTATIVAQQPVAATGHNYVDGYCTVCKAHDPSAYIHGDINGDNAVNNLDLTRLLKYVVGDVAEIGASADVNGDGAVNAKDLSRLVKYLADDTVELY